MAEIIKNKKNILIFLFVMTVIMALAHDYIEKLPYGVSNNQDLINRNIESTSKIWMNGYLGIFFRFHYFGIANWLIIPLFFLWIAGRVKEKWIFSLAFVYSLTVLMIGVKGYGNFRYQLTLFPFTITVIFLMAWDVYFNNNRNKKKKYFLIICFLFMAGGLIFFGYFPQRSSYKLLESDFLNGNLNTLPLKMIDYLNNTVKKGNGLILVCDQPWFYYHTGKKGIDYVDPKISNFYESKNKKDALDLLESMDIKYILVSRVYDRLWPGSYKGIRIREIISDNTASIFEDRGVQLLLIIKNRDQLYNDLYEPVFSKRSLVKNGSFEKWQANQNPIPNFWQIYGEGSVQKEKSDKKVGKYALKITGDNFNFYQHITLSGLASEKKMSCFAWLKTAVPNKYRIQIYDGIDSSESERHTGDGKWQILRVIHTINPQAKSLELRVVQAEKTGVLDVVYVDGVLLFRGEHYGPSTWLMEQDHLMHSVIEKSTSR